MAALTYTERYKRMTTMERKVEDAIQARKAREADQRRIAREARHANRLAIIDRRRQAGY
jgi:hypothetical protein